MNIIKTHPVEELGYNFIDPKYIPEGQDEYHIRDMQNEGKKYRALTTLELDTLIETHQTIGTMYRYLKILQRGL
jgi:hypothetical protein